MADLYFPENAPVMSAPHLVVMCGGFLLDVPGVLCQIRAVSLAARLRYMPWSIQTDQGFSFLARIDVSAKQKSTCDVAFLRLLHPTPCRGLTRWCRRGTMQHRYADREP